MTNTEFATGVDDSTGIASISSNLQITGGKLSILSGDNGAVTAVLVTLDNNATSFEVRAKPNDDCAISYFQVSNNGGVSYNNSGQRYSLTDALNTSTAFTTTGKRIVVKITLISSATYTAPQLDSFTLNVK